MVDGAEEVVIVMVENVLGADTVVCWVVVVGTDEASVYVGVYVGSESESEAVGVNEGVELSTASVDEELDELDDDSVVEVVTSGDGRLLVVVVSEAKVVKALVDVDVVGSGTDAELVVEVVDVVGLGTGAELVMDTVGLATDVDEVIATGFEVVVGFWLLGV